MSVSFTKIKKGFLWSTLVITITLGLTYGQLWGPGVGISSDTVQLTMVYGSEKRSWVEQITPLFKAQWESNHPGQYIELKFEAAGSGSSMLDILSGSINPVIWSPSSSFWVTLANWLWQQELGGIGDLVRNNESFQIIYSPVVIATWEEYQTHHNITGFQSLHDLAVNPDIGFTYAHTNPQLSNSGFLTMLMEIVAASGINSSEITFEDLQNLDTQNWLTELESAAYDYGSSTGFLARQALEIGPSSLDAVIVYENLVISINQEGGPLARWGQRLKAVYPVEGTILSNHMFCIMNLPTITSEQKEAALEFYEFITSYEIQEIAMLSGFRPIRQDVPLDESVFNTEYGVVQNLTSQLLTPPIDGEVLWRIPDLWQIVRNR
ncbi:MAG: substrate-binding domain-containing protein [Candidatus Ranarchaeia archaeon]|jgi:Ca-activated chloride channel family protein